jgi:AI-2 transport protein TqsA
MRVLVGVASLVVIVAGLRATSAIMIPLVLALFLALLAFPLVRLLQRLHINAVLAVLVTVLAVLAALVGPGMVIVAAVRQFASAVPGYEAQLRQITTSGFAWLRENNVDTSALTAFADPSRALEMILATLTGVVTLLSVGILVVIVSAFMMIEAAGIFERRNQVLGDSQRHTLTGFIRDLQTYLWVKSAVSLATGLAAWGWCSFLGIDFALLWGMLAFLLNYIPTFGSLVAAVPPVLLALIQFGPLSAGVTIAGYIGINVAFGSLLEPTLLGHRLRLSPLVVLLSVILWGWIWGIAGALLSVPITMAIKIGLEQSEQSRWIASLLEGGRRRRRGIADDGGRAAGIPAAAP